MADTTMTGTPQSQSHAETRRYNVERSCIRCHRRKIRCNRSKPCSTCAKTGNATSCRYPGPERTQRRAQTQHTATIVQQVGRLERIVSGVAEHANSSSGDHDRGSLNFTGLLIKNSNLVRYVNDNVLSHILEKEEEIRSAVASPHNSAGVHTPSSVARPLSLLHPISPISGYQDSEQLLPVRRRAVQLWQTFSTNVDPVHKLLHIPTIEPIIYKAINEPFQTSPDLRALLFAIFFSALTSTLRDAMEVSIEERRTQLDQFRCGLEISLSQADALDQPSIYSLQAMALFLSVFRCFGSGRSIWTMNGMVIRVAQVMGIHRDGKLFNLSPLDQEVRRRLWWKIISTDSRTLEDQGMWVSGNRSLGDSPMPLNIDDRDIGPNTTSMPPERTGFTKATPLVSICHIQVAGEAVAELSLCAELEDYAKRLPIAKEAIAGARKELESKFFFNCDLHIPLQRLFRNGTKMVLDKLEWRCQEGLFRRQQRSGSPRSQNEGGFATGPDGDDLFVRACELLEASLDLVSNEMYASFTWHSSSYLPYELLTFVLWRLYNFPTGSSADSAWHIVLGTFSVIEETSLLPDMGPRWNILCKLKEKVGMVRTYLQDGTDILGSSRIDTPGGEGAEVSVGTGPLVEDMWDPKHLLFPTEWPAFYQNLSIEGMDW